MLCCNDGVQCDLASCYSLCRFIFVVFITHFSLFHGTFIKLYLVLTSIGYLFVITGLSKFYFDVHVCLLKFMHVECICANVRSREVFETGKLLLTSVKPILDVILDTYPEVYLCFI